MLLHSTRLVILQSSLAAVPHEALGPFFASPVCIGINIAICYFVVIDEEVIDDIQVA